MGFFVNLTQVFYNNTNCNGTYYLYKQTLDECFGEMSTCCANFLKKDSLYNTCINGTINFCNVFDSPTEEMGYILQIFGVLAVVVLSSIIIYAFIRIICYNGMENYNDNGTVNKNLQRGSYEEI